MSFAIGSLVRARGREWVVLPESQEDLLILRPLGGTDEEVAGVHTRLEAVAPATFELPDPRDVGDFRSARLLRDAVRISSRAGAGPFRSFARIAVEPRPYQLVPLLLALRQEPVRLLIADDVGIGKTVEAALIARELLDRGEIRRIAVLCPPHLAEQWQNELREKFHIRAELVLPSTAARLERRCRLGESLFEHYDHVIVSMDFIKSSRRQHEFLRTCPELVIVDEAHTCAFAYEGRGSQHQRHELVKRLSEQAERHLLLVTATPHSGKEEAFRSLLTLLDPRFANLPADLTGPENEPYRRDLAAHFVQRRRGDIRHFMKEETPFPKREEAEATYTLTEAYRDLFDRVLAYARETVQDADTSQHRQRVRWWSALALLRSLASSPAAAASTLRNRAAVAESGSAEEADEVGRKTVLDETDADLADMVDTAPGADVRTGEDAVTRQDPRLARLARQAEKLQGKGDAKLEKAVELVESLLRKGHAPILFCRFIPTAEYVTEELRKRLPKKLGAEVMAVTGKLAPAEREERIFELGGKRAEGHPIVLVCTDCLSEGINLQEHFDAVVHYDLSWSPTRHEQREGRVDRYGQPKPEVRVLTYYGVDNQIDGIVLDVLLRKHKAIRSSLGVSVPVPTDTNAVVEAVFEGMLLREKGGSRDPLLPGLEEYLRPQKEELHSEWDRAAEREKRSRSLFAQATIKADEVAVELEAARAAVGSAEVVRRFTEEAVEAYGGSVAEKKGRAHVDLSRTPRALRDLFLDVPDDFEAGFELPLDEGVVYLARTHPVVEGLASFVMDTALDPHLGDADGSLFRARRAGAIRTSAVPTRTTLLLCRFRFDIATRRGRGKAQLEETQLAEECGLLAFRGAADKAAWLPPEEAEGLMNARPSGNVTPEQARSLVEQVVTGFEGLRSHVEEAASHRAEALLEAHRRVRQAARLKGLSYTVEPQLPVDVLGIYVFLPDPSAGRGAR